MWQIRPGFIARRLALVLCAVLSTAPALADDAALKLDFETPQLQARLLAGEGATDPLAGKTSPSISTIPSSGQGLTVERDHRTLSPGERWALIRLRIDRARYPNATVTAAIHAIGQDKPAAQATQPVTFDRVWAWCDLRRLNLSHARLAIVLRDGEQVVGATEMLLSAAAPETPMQPGQRVEVKLDVPADVAGTDRQVPVTFGFPISAGAVWDLQALRLVDRQGQPIPFQSEVTGRWSKDGALQWVRFDARLDPANGCFVEFAPAGEVPVAPATPVKVTQAGDRIVLETAGVTYTLGAAGSPIQSIQLGQKTIATSVGARGLYVVDQNGRLGTASAEGATIRVEASGPLAASVRIEGPYADDAGQVLARHITRVELFAGQPAAKVTHTLVLVNDSNEVWFKDVGWALKTDVGTNAGAIFNQSREQAGKVVRVPLAGPDSSAWMIQDAHVRYQGGINHFAISSQAATSAAGKLVAEGEECGDWAALQGSAATVVIGCREAARQHPKEFALSPGGVDLKLFSSRAGEELDFRVATRMQIWNISQWLDTGAVAKTYREGAEDRIRDIPSNAIGWAKTHELTFGVLPADAPVAAAAAVGQINSRGVFASADPQWVYQSRAMGPLHPRDAERFPAEEKLIDGAFDWWAARGPNAGEWGFVDAFSGPHMAYRGSTLMPLMRRFPLSYTVRRDYWLLYARSGDRRIRETASDSVRTFMDACMARWDGNGKIRGLYISQGDGPTWGMTRSPESVPLYWQGLPKYETGGTSDLDTFAWHYQLTGYRRAAEAITEYADALRRNWTPKLNRTQYRQMRLLLQVAQCYGFTGDETFRIMAEDLVDVLWEPQGELRIRRDKPYGSGYKMQSDTACLLYAYGVLRGPQLEEMLDAVTEAFTDVYLAQHPFEYGFPMGVVGNRRYAQTGDPAIAVGALISNRLAVSNFDPERGAFGKAVMFAPAVRGIFEGIPYQQHVIRESDADRKTIASWASFETADQPVEILIRKEGPQKVHLRVINRAYETAMGQAGNGPVLDVWEAGDARQANIWTLGLNRVTSGQGRTAHVHVAVDAPPGVYRVSRFAPGVTTVVADGVLPLVIRAPGGLKAGPAVTRVYFQVPDNAPQARVTIEGSARVFAPDGSAVDGGKAIAGQYDLPAGKPGLWSVEAASAGRISLENVPPLFTLNDPALYFDLPPSAAAKADADAD